MQTGKYFMNTFLKLLLSLGLCILVTGQESSLGPLDSSSIDSTLPDPCLDPQFTDCSICPCPSTQPGLDVWAFTVSCISAGWSILFIVSFLTVKALREVPGDLVFGATIAELILSSTTITEKAGVVLFGSNLFSQIGNEAATVIFGLIRLATATLVNFYVFMFFANYVLTLKNSPLLSKLKRRHIHSAALLATILVTSLLLSWRALGYSAVGPYGVSTSPGMMLPMMICGISAFLFLCMVFIVKKEIVSRKNLEDLQTDFIRHYLFYLLVVCNLFVISAILHVIAGTKLAPDANSLTLNDQISTDPVNFVKFVIMSLCPLVLGFSRIREPLIYGHIKGFIRGLACFRSQSFGRNQSQLSICEEKINNEELANDFRLDMTKGLLCEDDDVGIEQWCSGKTKHGNFEKSHRIELVTSVLASMAYYWKRTYQDLKLKGQEWENRDGYDSNKMDKKLGLNRRKVFIHSETIKKTVPHVVREIRRRHKGLLSGNFTAFGTDLFKEVIELDDSASNLKDSWNFVRNYGNLLSYEYQVDEFGKMFFTASNGKYMLKEISRAERKNLLRLLPGYVKHLKATPHSLLARIYGIFSFRAKDQKLPINVIVVRNTANCAWPAIAKQYKLREPPMEPRSAKQLAMAGHIVLDEKAFEYNERNLVLEPTLQSQFLTALNKDVQFLMLNSVLNYALQVVMVNQETYCAEMLSSSVIMEAEELDELNESVICCNSEEAYELESATSTNKNLEDNEAETEGSSTEARTEAPHQYTEIVDFWKDSEKKKNLTFIWEKLRYSNYYNGGEAQSPEGYGRTFMGYIEGLVTSGEKSHREAKL